MSAPTDSDTELLTEHFGYPPVSLLDDLINSINILAERALNSVEQGLFKAPPAALGFRPPKSASAAEQDDPAERAKNEIESGTHQLETLLCASIDRNFDKLELYALRYILCVQPPDIRNYIRLSHYEGLDFSSSTAATGNSQDGTNGGTINRDKPTVDSIGELRRRLRESMRLNALLYAEQQRNARLLSDLQSLIGIKHPDVKRESTSTGAEISGSSPFAFLHQEVAQLKDAGADTPLSTTTAFTLSQLQALRALSTSLRTMAPHLAPVPRDEGDDEGRKSWRRERLEYVEAATRRHLENVQGLELGKDGEVRDGEWQGEGRNLAKGEVEGLENIVAALGSGGSRPEETANADGDSMEE
ncbi:Mis12 protein-domain-containing protein [Pseudomassariella vexata]|uniref:Mis12 protein-domain-containing protein n=1 Tax=Pseudomassariella vexata TaxID=1141098 RepID=A0A1Y2DIW1_9PEZI|nr:Mis12 protein-domain-containing protein [Pseudomassariella vexata]ORY59150.1 Mis12 protein-domain-containing protein [Pseudomassariella vexata]